MPATVDTLEMDSSAVVRNVLCQITSASELDVQRVSFVGENSHKFRGFKGNCESFLCKILGVG